jgi:hypothetical protein
MAFPQTVRDQAYYRAGGKCQCTRIGAGHFHRGQCGAILGNNWHCHHRTAVASGGDDTLSNAEALCIPRHQATETYGTRS